MSGRSFNQSVVMNNKELLDEELQATGGTPSTSHTGDTGCVSVVLSPAFHFGIHVNWLEWPHQLHD